MQKFVTLSVTEAESGAGVTTAQDMMFTYRLLNSMGLKVELPMLLEMDNKGAVDLANNYTVSVVEPDMLMVDSFIFEN